MTGYIESTVNDNFPEDFVHDSPINLEMRDANKIIEVNKIYGLISKLKICV